MAEESATMNESVNSAPITRFKYEHGFLSNSYPCPVFLGVHEYLTVEAAYQAAKTLDMSQRAEIRAAASPFLAKRLGGDVTAVTLRYGWDRMKREVMAELLFQKFVLNHTLRDKLLATGSRELIEGNDWKDFYWGVCQGRGENHLGKLLMAMREVARRVVVRACPKR